jgi:hypothetical protein
MEGSFRGTSMKKGLSIVMSILVHLEILGQTPSLSAQTLWPKINSFERAIDGAEMSVYRSK